MDDSTAIEMSPIRMGVELFNGTGLDLQEYHLEMNHVPTVLQCIGKNILVNR